MTAPQSLIGIRARQILDGVTDEAERNQLIAECIFETDDVANDWYE